MAAAAVCATPSAFDLLRGFQRRSGGSALGTGLLKEELRNVSTPLLAGTTGIDERHGVWWTVRGREVSYVPLLGPQWPPRAVHLLPTGAKASARCVTVLSGGGGENESSSVESLAVCTDLRVIVWRRNQCLEVPSVGMPIGEVPAFVTPAAHHPHANAVGFTLVVGTRAGRVFSLYVRTQDDHSYQAQASAIWPLTSAENGLRGVLNRVRGIAPLETNARVRAVEVITPRAGSKARGHLFVALALCDRELACYAHDASCSGASLQWVLPLAQMADGDLCGSRLLALAAVPPQGASDVEELLALYTRSTKSARQITGSRCGDAVRDHDSTFLVRMSWKPWSSVPKVGLAQLIGPSPEASFDSLCDDADWTTAASLRTSGSKCVVAMRIHERRCVLTAIDLAPTGDTGLQPAPHHFDLSVLGMCLPAGGTTIKLLTTNGILDCPQLSDSMSDDMQDVEADGGSSLSALLGAYEHYSTGKEQQARHGVARACQRYPSHELLQSVMAHTRTLMDMPVKADDSRWEGVGRDVVSRHFLFDKARVLQQWLAFLSDTCAWTFLSAADQCAAARLAVVEACERVAAFSQLRDFHEQAPELFAEAVRRLSREDAATGASVESDADEFSCYTRVSNFERLLGVLPDCLRSLSQDSSHRVPLVLFVNSVFVSCLIAVLDKRFQVVASYPTILPAPKPSTRYFDCSVDVPCAVGSNWMVTGSLKRTLADLRRVTLEVLPPAPLCLPTLTAQALRLVESMEELCHASLLAAHAAFGGDLHCDDMVEFRRSVLQHLATAEATIDISGAPRGRDARADSAQRTLLLAEQFEDLEAVIHITATSNRDRLDEHLQRSEKFRARALEQFLRTSELQPLFFQTIKRYPLAQASQHLLDELLHKHPEIVWTLELHGLQRGGGVPNSDHADTAAADATAWHAALERVRNHASARAQHERHSAARRDAFLAMATIASYADEMGTYTISYEGVPVQRGVSRQSPVVTVLPKGTKVEVVEQAPSPVEGRVRARIAHPAGWISVRHDNGTTYAEKELSSKLDYMGHLQQVCMRFGKHNATIGSKRPNPPDEPPHGAEGCTLELVSCLRTALRTLRAEGAESKLLASATRLVLEAEQRLENRRVCPDAAETWYSEQDGRSDSGEIIAEEMLTSLDQAKARCSGLHACAGFTFSGSFGRGPVSVLFKTAWGNVQDVGSGWTSYQKHTFGEHGNGAAQMEATLRSLWGEVIVADMEAWTQITHAPEGADRDALIKDTGYYRMLKHARELNAAELPRHAEIDGICGQVPELRELKPALRIAERLLAYV